MVQAYNNQRRRAVGRQETEGSSEIKILLLVLLIRLSPPKSRALPGMKRPQGQKEQRDKSGRRRDAVPEGALPSQLGQPHVSNTCSDVQLPERGRSIRISIAWFPFHCATLPQRGRQCFRYLSRFEFSWTRRGGVQPLQPRGMLDNHADLWQPHPPLFLQAETRLKSAVHTTSR